METVDFSESQMNRSALREALDFEEQLLEKYTQLESKSHKRINSHANEFEILRKIYPDFKYVEIEDLVGRTLVDIRKYVVDLNRMTTSMVSKGNTVCPVSVAILKDSVQRGDDVKCLLEDDAVYIKMPLLWNRQINKKISKSKAIQFEKANTIFENSVEFAIENHPDFYRYDFSRFKEKRFQFLFCYDLQRSKIDRIPDNDNHDFKSIQDTIAQYFHGGDSAFSSETVLSSCASQDVSEGTYVTITRLADNPIPNKNVINKWASIDS